MFKNRRLLLLITVILLANTFFIIWANRTICTVTAPFISDHTDSLPTTNVALVLGTSKFLKNGQPNPYFSHRIKAASKLYHQGKIKYLIVSGDNKQTNYNEPAQMKKDLIALGIPASRIYSDYAGFRTLDSIIRAKTVFQQQKFIIVSQRFHNERAVYLARRKGIEAYGYNATDVNRYAGLRTRVREILAKAAVFVDITIGTQPKFLGETITIPST